MLFLEAGQVDKEKKEKEKTTRAGENRRDCLKSGTLKKKRKLQESTTERGGKKISRRDNGTVERGERRISKSRKRAKSVRLMTWERMKD